MLTQVQGFGLYRMNIESESREFVGPIFMDMSGTVHVLDMKAGEGYEIAKYPEATIEALPAIYFGRLL